jgi:hypothetical protein
MSKFEKYITEGSASIRAIKGKANMEVAFGSPAINIKDPKTGMGIRVIFHDKDVQQAVLNFKNKFDVTFDVTNFPTDSF